MQKKMFILLLLAAALTFTGLSISAASIASSGTATIYPNKLTITWADGSKAPTTIDTFRFNGYNVAQLRTMVSALGGAVTQLQDGTYQINASGAPVAHTDIGFTTQTDINYALNQTSIRDISGNLLYPKEPGWVLLTDYSYNWASIRDILNAIGLKLDSFTDDAEKGTLVVISRPGATGTPEVQPTLSTIPTSTPAPTAATSGNSGSTSTSSKWDSAWADLNKLTSDIEDRLNKADWPTDSNYKDLTAAYDAAVKITRDTENPSLSQLQTAYNDLENAVLNFKP